MIIHTVRRGQFVAALRPPGATLPGPISHLALGSEGQIVVQSSACERPGAQVWGQGTQQRRRGNWNGGAVVDVFLSSRSPTPCTCTQ